MDREKEEKSDLVDLRIKIDNDILKQIKAISALKSKSMNSLIREIFKEYLKRYKVELIEQNPEKEK